MRWFWKKRLDTRSKVSDFNWSEIQKRSRVFIVPDGFLITSKQTIDDLPIQGSPWPKPSGKLYEKNRKKYGDSIARFFWRNEMGLSSMAYNLEACLRTLEKKKKKK